MVWDSHGLCQCASATYLLLIDWRLGGGANCLLQHSRCRRHECARTQDEFWLGFAMFEATCWSLKFGVQWLTGCSLLCVTLDWSWHGYLGGILRDIYPKLPKLPPGFSMDSWWKERIKTFELKVLWICRSTSTCRKKKLPTDPPLLRLRANEGQFVRFLFAFLQMHMLSHFLLLLVSGSTGSMADSTWFNEANAPSIPGITWQVWASWWGIYVDVPFFE